MDDGDIAGGVAAGVLVLEVLRHKGDAGGYAASLIGWMMVVVVVVGGYNGGGGGETMVVLLFAVHYLFCDVGGWDAGTVANW